jgi:DNA-binding CsgD family transcriptional regulator
LLDEARGGAGGVVVITGEPGMGKSALLAWATSEARGFRMLRARGLESETELPFAALGDLLRPVVSELEQIPERQAAALAGALAIGPPAPSDRFAVAVATLSLLSAASEREPLLAIVDDAHWVDGLSLEALLFAARRLNEEPVCLLLAVRPDEGTFRGEALDTLTLAGLERTVALELLDDVADLHPLVARQIADATGGNPLALLELPRQLSSDQLSGREALPVQLSVAPAIERNFLRRVQGLPETTRRALVVAAASDSDDAEIVVSALAELRLDRADLAPAEADGLIVLAQGRLDFFHPLLRSSLYSSLPPEELRGIHAAYGRALSGDQNLERRAAHLAEATEAPDDSVAATLESAADRALARGGYAAAARTLHRAASLTVTAPERARRMLRAAQNFRLAGDHELALHLLDEALVDATDEPLLSAEIHHVRIKVVTTIRLPLHAGLTLAREAERIAARDPAKAALLFAHAAQTAAFSGNGSDAVAAARRSRELLADGHGELDGETAVLLGHAFLLTGQRSSAEEMAGEVGEALENGGRDSSEVGMFYASLLFWLEAYEPARQELQSQIAAARGAGALGVLPQLLDTLAAVDTRAGRWVDAYATSTEALALARETRDGRQTASTLTTLARLEAGQGKADDCRAHAQEAMELARRYGDKLAEAWAIAALGLLELGLGQSDEAIREFTRIQNLADADTLFDSAAVMWRADRIEAHVRARRAKDLGELDTPALATSGSAWVRAASARAAALVIGPEKIDDAFAEALSLHEEAGIPFELARTELCYGERLRRARRLSDARRPLRSALATFERLGAAPWADRARKELAASGERSSPSGRNARIAKLTGQELQVALLVADGATNREAAAALFVSPKTIEGHLGRAYAKLGVRSRTELARLLTTDEPTSLTATPARRSRVTVDQG